MVKKKKSAHSRNAAGTPEAQNPIEVFSSELNGLEEGEREEEIALYMEELEKSGSGKDPDLLAEEARRKAREVLRRYGVTPSYGWDRPTTSYDGFAEEEPEPAAPEKGKRKGAGKKTDKQTYYGSHSQKKGGQPTMVLVLIGALAAAVVVLVVVMAVFLRPAFTAPEDTPAVADGSSAAEQMTPSGSDQEALALPEGIENATGVTLDLSDGVYTVTVGDAFGITASRPPYPVQNYVEDTLWTCALAQGEATITLPSWMDTVTLSMKGAQVTLENVQTGSLELSAENGDLTVNGVTAQQMTLHGNQATVEAQAAAVEEAVNVELSNGFLHLVMPAPQEYGYHVTCNNGMVRVGSTPYLTEETSENEEAPFQYTVDCTSGTVEVDLAADGTTQEEPAEDGDSAAQPEDGADSEG